ncbi:glycosyltransferase [Flavobacterium ponti]|uniref:Glycosyltransferase n=1 Tax=Flavobacterium ponti TaxID=665133 RepID=A0ABV9NYJ8_9FLAO
MPKKIIHIAEDVSLTSGGLRSMITDLNNQLNLSDLSSKIITLKKEENDVFDLVESKQNFWNYSSDYQKKVEIDLNPTSILHLHGVWMYPQYIAAKISEKNNIPSILTCHGMLEPYLLNDKKLKKYLYLNIILKSILKKTKIIHAITEKEKNNIFNLTKHPKIIEIPNLINIDKTNSLKYDPKEEYILFLGRFHAVKGIELLVEAFEKIDNKNIKLYLVGFKNDYCMSILELINKKGLNKRIRYYGEAKGIEKNILYANAKAFVAPSFSEVIGMVNLEAASFKTPVITTYNTGLSKQWNKNGGFLINPVLEELVKTLNIVCTMHTNERIERGICLYDFVLKNYSWNEKGYLWNELYKSL